MKIQILGFKELEAALGELPKALRRQVVLRAGQKAARPIIAEARTRARRQTNPRRRGGYRLSEVPQALADSITVSAVKPNPAYPTEVAVKVGPTGDHFYGLFVEKGTQAHGHRDAVSRALTLRRSRKTGELKLGVRRKRRGKLPHAATRKFPFLEPAFKMHAEAAAKAMGEEMWKEIAAKARSLARSAEKGTISKAARGALLE